MCVYTRMSLRFGHPRLHSQLWYWNLQYISKWIEYHCDVFHYNGQGQQIAVTVAMCFCVISCSTMISSTCRCLQETIPDNDNKFVITRMWTVMFYANLVRRQPSAVIIDFVKTLACCFKMADWRFVYKYCLSPFAFVCLSAANNFLPCWICGLVLTIHH